MSDLSDVNDFNRAIIEEFRANDGKVGGPFAGAPLLILHSTGARSGKTRLAPVMYRDLPGGDAKAIFASKAGAPDNPDWYHNLLADPEAFVELPGATAKVRARVAEGDERTEIWEAQKAEYPGFAEYEAKTDREIPVVILDPA